MYDSTLELAENKLLLLYIIKSIKYPISNTQLTDIVLENSFINYFMLQQYVSELISSEFLEYKTQDDDKEIIVLTEKGDKVLFFFKDRISPNKLKLIDEYVKNDSTAFYSYSQFKNSLDELYKLGNYRSKSISLQLTGVIPSTKEAQNQVNLDEYLGSNLVNMSLLGSMGGGKGDENKVNAMNQNTDSNISSNIPPQINNATNGNMNPPDMDINQGGINELVLIDVLKDKAEGEAMDLAHGLSCAPSRIDIKAGDYDECKDADIVVITAGLAQKPGQTRLDLAKTNAGIMKSVTEQVVASGFKGICPEKKYILPTLIP